MQARQLNLLRARDVAKVEYPERWLDALKEFVQQVDGEYTTIHGLLVAVAGGSREAHMLREILFWWGKGAEKDAIWKSFKEWLNSPAMLTRSNVETARRNLRKLGLIDFWQPEHSLHRSMRYRLHEFRLVARIAQVCQMRTADVLECLTSNCGDSAGACAETPQMHSQSFGRTYIRTNSTTNSMTDSSTNMSSVGKATEADFYANDDDGSAKKYSQRKIVHLTESVRELVAFGCDKQGLTKVQYAPVEEVKHIIQQAKKKKWLKNPQGWAIKRIERGLAEGFEERKAEANNWLEDLLCRDCGSSHCTCDSKDDTKFTPHTATDLFNYTKKPESTEEDAWIINMKQRSGPAEELRQAWQQLELQLDAASFDVYLKKAVYRGFKDSEYRIEVATRRVQEMCQHRLYRNIRRVLNDIRGSGREVEIEFIYEGES